jgi:hypothetical protein
MAGWVNSHTAVPFFFSGDKVHRLVLGVGLLIHFLEENKYDLNTANSSMSWLCARWSMAVKHKKTCQILYGDPHVLARNEL